MTGSQVRFPSFDSNFILLLFDHVKLLEQLNDHSFSSASDDFAMSGCGMSFAEILTAPFMIFIRGHWIIRPFR